METYQSLLSELLTAADIKSDRTGTGTRGYFASAQRFYISKTIPVVTTKKIHLKSVIHELLWFIKGSTNIKYLTDNGVTIWNEWADENGELGPVYGKQWRKWEDTRIIPTEEVFDYKEKGYRFVGAIGDTRNSVVTREIDQLANAIERLKTNPECRRIIVSAWNPGEIQDMKLPPCHMLFQFYAAPLSTLERVRLYTTEENKEELVNNLTEEMLDEANVPKYGLSLMWYQRSVDTFLGLPFNIASYAILTRMVAQVVNMAPKDLIYFGGDTHLYSNHEEQAKEQIQREPMKLPTLKLNPNIKNIDDFKFEDIVVENYQSHPPIKAPVSK